MLRQTLLNKISFYYFKILVISVVKLKRIKPKSMIFILFIYPFLKEFGMLPVTLLK